MSRKVIGNLVASSKITADDIATAVLEGIANGDDVIVPDEAARFAYYLKWADQALSDGGVAYASRGVTQVSLLPANAARLRNESINGQKKAEAAFARFDFVNATFAAQKALPVDVFLASHAAQFGMHQKYKPGDPYDPSRFVDAQGYLAAVERLEGLYREQLASGRAAR